MNFVKYDGKNVWAKQLKKYLNDKLNYLVIIFPKILKHIEGNEIIILDVFSEVTDKNTRAFYNRIEKNIYIIASNQESRLTALHSLIHEIGHSIQDRRKTLDIRYNSETKNISYWREEIKAESYALQIFVRFLDVGNLIEYAKNYINFMYKGLKDANKKTNIIFYSYKTYTNGGCYFVNNSNSNTTSVSWTGFISYSTSTSQISWSYNYVC